MAARSSGLFPREGFNLDAECEITTSSASAAVTLTNAKTIRVIGIGVTVDVVATLGGVAVEHITDFGGGLRECTVLAHVCHDWRGIYPRRCDGRGGRRGSDRKVECDSQRHCY